ARHPCFMTCAYFRPDHCLVERLGENSGGGQSAMHSNTLKEHKKNEGMIEGQACNFRDGTWLGPGRIVQPLKTSVAVSLKEASEARHVRRRVLGTTVGAVEIGGGR